MGHKYSFFPPWNWQREKRVMTQHNFPLQSKDFFHSSGPHNDLFEGGTWCMFKITFWMQIAFQARHCWISLWNTSLPRSKIFFGEDVAAWQTSLEDLLATCHQECLDQYTMLENEILYPFICRPYTPGHEQHCVNIKGNIKEFSQMCSEISLVVYCVCCEHDWYHSMPHRDVGKSHLSSGSEAWVAEDHYTIFRCRATQVVSCRPHGLLCVSSAWQLP